MKWSRIKRITSLVLCVLMVFALLPVSSLADEVSSPAPADPVATPQQEATPAPAGEHTTPAQDATAEPVSDTDQPTPSPVPTPTELTASPELQAYLVNL